MATHYATFKNGDIHTKILISKQQLILENLTYYQINPETYHFFLLVGYGNYLVSIFKYINENIRNKRNGRKIKGCTYKITNISPATYSRVPKLVLYQYLDIEPLPNGRIGKITD